MNALVMKTSENRRSLNCILTLISIGLLLLFVVLL